MCARVHVRVHARMCMYVGGRLCSCACLVEDVPVRADVCVDLVHITNFFSERAIDFCICFGVNLFIDFFLFILPNFICLLL